MSDKQTTSADSFQTYPSGMVSRLVKEMRLVCIADMRAMVEQISSARDNPQHQDGIRWAQARMLHYLSEMENAIP